MSCDELQQSRAQRIPGCQHDNMFGQQTLKQGCVHTRCGVEGREQILFLILVMELPCRIEVAQDALCSQHSLSITPFDLQVCGQFMKCVALQQYLTVAGAQHFQRVIKAGCGFIKQVHIFLNVV